MAALLAAFVACLLAGIGGGGQKLAILLAERFGQGKAATGLALSSILNAAISAGIGYGLARIMPVPGRMLLLGLSLLCCGGSMLFKARAPSDPGTRGGLFTIIVTSMALHLGDRGQFVVTGIACAYPVAALAGVGGALGTFGALVPALVMGRDLEALPLTLFARMAAFPFLVAGFFAAVDVLGLI